MDIGAQPDRVTTHLFTPFLLMRNLIESLRKEMSRVRGLITEYESLPWWVWFIGASIMKVEIQNAERAIEEWDIV